MHVLTKKLLLGLEDLKHNPGSPVVGGVYKQTFDVFIHQTIGGIDLTQPQNIDKAKTQLEQLPSVSGKLEDLEKIYKVAQNHCDFGLHELRLDKNQGVSEADLQTKSADLIAKSVAHVTIATSLPETHLDNPKIVQRLSAEIYSKKELALVPDLTNDLKTTINHVVADAQAPALENKTVESLANKAAINITGKSGGGINLAILSSAALIVALLNRPSEEPPEEVNKPETEEGGGGGTFGQLTGLGLGAILTRGDTNEKETSEQKQPPIAPVQPGPIIPKMPVPISISAPTALKSITSSIINSFGGFFKKSLGGIFKKALNWGLTAISGGVSKLLAGALKTGGKLLPFFGTTSQADPGNLLKKASIVIALIIVIPLLLIIGLSYFDTAILKPTALVTSTTPSSSGTASSVSSSPGCQTGVGGGETVAGEPCPIDVTLVVFAYPTPGTTTGIVPQGFPVSSSCVTQPPRSSGTHSNLNAVDIAPVNQDDVLVIRATHPGKVIHVGDFGGYGLAVLLEDSDKRYITYYGHLLPGKVNVNLGDQINTGTELGIVDSRGVSTGNHLHYEIRGPRDLSSTDKYWGSKTGEFGEIGTIMNFIPDCKTWSCQWFCNK